MESDWLHLALKAMKLAFDQNEQFDPNRTPQEINEAKQIFYECLKYRVDAAWIYIKLADLVSEEKEKIRLYEESLFVEETDFAKARIYDLTQ